MEGLHHSPGEAAEQAFTFGLAAALLVGASAIFFLWWLRILTIMTAVLASVVGLPVLLIGTSCVLSVWLGYNRSALDSAIETERP